MSENLENTLIDPNAPDQPGDDRALKMAKLCIRTCEESKAQDILLFDVHEKTIFADYYLVCSGNSMPHIRAVVDHVRRAMAEAGFEPRGVDGQPQSRWMVLDYGLLIVHVLEPEMRNFYALEELWDDRKIAYRGGDQPR